MREFRVTLLGGGPALSIKGDSVDIKEGGVLVIDDEMGHVLLMVTGGQWLTVTSCGVDEAANTE